MSPLSRRMASTHELNPPKPLVAMKTLIPLTALAALTASGTLSAQTPAFSKPSGYVTQKLEANTFNLVGITLQPSAIATGSFETVAGNVLTDEQANFVAEAGTSYILEIVTDANADANIEGTVQVIPAANITSTTITTPDDLGSFGLKSGATYTLSPAPTIEDIFGTETSVLSKGPNAASPLSDIVWVPDGSGGYTRYFIRSSDSTVRNAQTAAAAPNTPIVFTDGLLVQKKNTGESSLVITGQVKTTVASLVVIPGFNVVGTTFPAGATLQNIGLETSISAGPNAASTLSDVVWIPSAGGVYTRYYFRSSDSSWRNAQTNAAATPNLPLTSAILVQRKGVTSINATLTPPSSYDKL